MDSRGGFGVAPKKRIVTYGKAGKRSALGVMRRTESSPAAPRVQKVVSETPVEQPAVSHPEPLSQSSTPERPTVKPLIVELPTIARPAPKKAKPEEVVSRAKKRRVVPSATTNNEDAIWSPPSSPPPLPPPTQKASPKRTVRAYGTKASSAQAVKPRAGRAAGPSTEEVMETTAPFSAKTTRTIRELSIDNRPPAKTQAFPLRLTRSKPPLAPSVPRKAPEPVVRKGKPPERAAPSRPRKRLIDALAAQVEESSESEEEQQRSQEVVMSVPSSPPPAMPVSPTVAESSQARRTLQRQVSMTKKSGPKFTYSQQRTMLAEDSMMDMPSLGNVEEESQPRAPFLGFGSQPQMSQMSQFSFEDDEEDLSSQKRGVQPLHELRQSGANYRTSQEMDDILDRVGSPSAKPSSLRRGALLELAQKMKDQNFRRQFRNHSDVSSGKVFAKLGEETDMVAGYAVISIITTLLATSPSQHLIQKLEPQSLASLLLLLIEEASDVSLLAKDRKRNISRATQTTLSAMKAVVLGLSTWDALSPTLLSPRILALKALQLLIEQGVNEAELFSPTVTDKLFSIVSNHSDAACWDFPNQPESIEFYLALSLLEQHSVHAMQSTVVSRWNTDYLPIVADILGVALERPADKFNDLESLVLKLTLNTTNNNHEAGGMFVDRGLLRALAEAACRTFDVVLKSIMDDAFMSKVLDSLILMLGVGINFCEHYPPAAQNLVGDGGEEKSTMDKLIRVFLDYHASTADADSMEKTQLNVAFSYHSILLGYLCLYAPVRERFMSIHSKRSLEPLLESIREFIVLHRRTLAAMDGEPATRPEADAVNRLQSLVHELKREQ